MVIRVTLTDSEARADFRDIACDYGVFTVADDAVNFVKGACLHCLGDFRTVPDRIEFKLVDGRTEKR